MKMRNGNWRLALPGLLLALAAALQGCIGGDVSVQIEATPTSGLAPLEVAFRATASVPDAATAKFRGPMPEPDPGAPVIPTVPVYTPTTVVGYRWDFGDGSEGAGKELRHTYQGAGVYTVTVTAS